MAGSNLARWTASVLAVGWVAAGRSVAQVPERRLTAPNGKLAHPFSSVTGFRDLGGGRTMISDGIDQVVVVADWAKGRLDTLGRVGQGPGEYKTPDALVALPRGATLLVDLGNGRLSVFDAAGKYRESMPIAQGQLAPGRIGGLQLIMPRGADGEGRLYYQSMASGPRADSGAVVRWDRVKNTKDTVAMVKLPALVSRTTSGADSRSTRQRANPYPMQDGWTVTSDGRIALVRAPGYRVDWVGSDRAFTKGKPIAVTPVSIGKNEKLEWVGEQANSGLNVSVENRNGQVSMSFRRGRAGGDDEAPDLDQYVWPATKPPFVVGELFPTPTGEIWVERSTPAGAARSYDVFDQRGELVGRIILPAGRRVVGVGAGVVYTRQIDDNGVSWLERYPL